VVPDARKVGSEEAAAVSRVRRLHLELENRPDGVCGVVHDEHGNSVPFWGWLDLVHLLAPVTTDDPPEQPTERNNACPDC
jgi:hypothetical protein